MRLASRLIAFCAIALAAPFAQAQNCAGFTDVPDTSQFCPNIEWLKNRQITLGCGGGLFCPFNFVPRQEMAAFMDRLGRKLSPEVLEMQDSVGVVPLPGEPPTPPAIVCVTPDTQPTAYPRGFIYVASVTGLADGAVAWRGFLLFSTDSGVSWQSDPNAVGPRASAAAASQWTGLAITHAGPIAAGEKIRFAIGMRRDNVVTGTTGNFTTLRCQVTASIVNQNGTSSPFDAASLVPAFQ